MHNTELVWMAIVLAVLVLCLVVIGAEVLTKKVFGISLSDKIFSRFED